MRTLRDTHIKGSAQGWHALWEVQMFVWLENQDASASPARASSESRSSYRYQNNLILREGLKGRKQKGGKEV